MRLSNSQEHLRGARRCNIAAISCMLLAIVGILLTTVIHDAILGALQQGLSDQYVLSSPSAGGYDTWVDSDVEGAGVSYTSFYVYHIVNPYEIAVLGQKPMVEEIGPLTYLYHQKKYNVTWDPLENDDIVTYKSWQYYTAVDDQTRAFEQMNVTTTNVPLFGALNNAMVVNSGLQSLLAALLVNWGYMEPMAMFVNRTAYEVIWGWEDPLLTKLHEFVPAGPTYYPGIQANESSADEALANHGENSIYTGKLTANLAREYVEWDGMDQFMCCSFGPCGDAISGPYPVLPFNTQRAQLIHGAFGDQFHQFVSSDDVLRVNSMGFGIFRTWEMVNANEEAMTVDGIQLLKFTWAPYVLGNMTTAPEDAFAYNLYGPAGLLNQSLCEWGAKIFISKPRFLDGSPSLRDGIANLLPATEDEHGTYLGVEPITGQTMDFHWRVGVNVHMAPQVFGGQQFFQNVTPVYMPIAWADRFGSLDDDQAAMFKKKIYVARDLIAAARWGGIALAGLAFLSSVAFFYVASVRRKRLEEAREIESSMYWADQFRPFLTQDGVQSVYPQGVAVGQGNSIQFSPTGLPLVNMSPNARMDMEGAGMGSPNLAVYGALSADQSASLLREQYGAATAGHM